MRTLLTTFLCLAFLCVMAADANACYKHGNSKWALHYAGVHGSKANTCAYTVTDCTPPAGQVVETGPMGPGRFDVFVLALDTNGITATRYGLECEPEFMFWFYGWTSCSDLELPTAGWPGCNQGNAQTWGVEQPAGHVTVGILDVYVYPGMAHLKTADDPRVGFGEWCDGSEPNPWCCRIPYSEYPAAFGYVGFGCPGYNPCGVVPVEQKSWGQLKSIYR